MGRPRIRTLEESQARDRATKQRYRETHHEQIKSRYNERYQERYKTNAKARHDARMAAMTPEEFEAYRAYQAAATRRYRAKDPEASRLQQREARQKNPEKSRGYVKKHRLKKLAANPNYYKEQYRKQTPEQVNAAAARRRARLRGVKRNDVTPQQRKLVLAAAHGRCAYCAYYDPACKLCPKGRHVKLTVDHITAVYHQGDNTLHNLVACCASCNSKKKISPNPVPVQPMLL
jgi:hypothetical protein